MSSNLETPIDYSNSKINETDDSFEPNFCKNNEKNTDSEIGFGHEICTNNKIEVDSGCGSSIHSNNSGSDDETNDNNNGKNDYNQNNDTMSGTENEKKPLRNPKCARCRNHGNEVPVKGHKRKCPFRECVCEHCILTDDRRTLMAKTIAVKRRQNEDIADNTYVPPKPVYKKKLADESDEVDVTDSKNSEKYFSESIVEEVFEFLINKIDSKQHSVREMISQINDKTRERNTESNEAFSLAAKVLREWELKTETKKVPEENHWRAKSPSSSKHGAFNIVYNTKPPNLSLLEMGSGQKTHNQSLPQFYSNAEQFPSPPYTPHSYSLVHPMDSHAWASHNFLINPFSIPKVNPRSCVRSLSSDISLDSHMEDNNISASSSMPIKCRYKLGKDMHSNIK